MIPVARTEQLLIQEVGNEVIVYDQINNTSHCLNHIAATVWHYCDGQHSVKEIAKLLEKELPKAHREEIDMRGLVWLTLEELEKYQLIKEYLKQPVKSSIVSRRTVIKTGTVVGGIALVTMFPVVKSMVAPSPAMATSGCETTTARLGVQAANNKKKKKCLKCQVDARVILGQIRYFCKGSCPAKQKCTLKIAKDGNSAECNCV